jgi:cytochrome c oxidase subunit 2
MIRRFALLSPLLLLSGCGGEQSMWNPHGPGAARIVPLMWAIIVLFLAVTLIMWILLVIPARRRGSLSEHDPVDIGGGQGWVALGGLLIPLVVLTGFFVAGLVLMERFPIHDPNNSAVMKPDILVIGHQWWWEVHYLDGPPDQRFETANEIHIPSGQPVTMEVESADVNHAFWVPALQGKIDMIPGHPNYMRIEASQPGNYVGQCAEYCGKQHAHMRLLVVAQSAADYKSWTQQMLQTGHTPATPDAIAGEQVFLSTACSTCHTVRGTPAGGHVAPDLTHLASRQYIGADSFPNNTAYLEAWITHAQSFKPGALMPNLTDYNGVQLRDLVAYLQQLK